MKKLKKYEIDAIVDKTYEIVKEEKLKQAKITFDESEEKEPLLNLIPQICQIQSKINELEKEQRILEDQVDKLKTTLIEKGVVFRQIGFINGEYSVDCASIYHIRHNIEQEFILMGIDGDIKVKDLIKELVDKFKK